MTSTAALGYGGDNSRPDLSNTSFMMEALRDTGLPADDPALQKALVFVSRCQNSRANSTTGRGPARSTTADSSTRRPTAGSRSVAGKTDGRRPPFVCQHDLRGPQSMIYAGLTADDPGSRRPCEFIRKHYTLDENPGLGQRGLYYYYQTFAKTLSLLGKPMFVDGSGKEHDWRADLVAALAKRQDSKGSWVNSTAGFMEGDANLVTAYGLLALAHATRKP